MNAIPKVWYDRRGNKYHLVKIIRDGSYCMVVFKTYGKHKQWWHYHIEEYDDVKSWLDSGLYSMKRVSS